MAEAIRQCAAGDKRPPLSKEERNLRRGRELC